MIIGFDTGFFIKLLKGDETTINVWQDLSQTDKLAVVSALSLFELQRLALKGVIKKEYVNDILECINSVCKIIWLNNLKILTHASNISHGTAIPAIDSLILASFLFSNVEIIYTTDAHFQNYKNKNITIVIV